MANVANTKNTGPTSKDAVSGGTKLPFKDKTGSIGGMPTLGTSSEEAHRIIMGMRVQSTDFASRNAEKTLGSVKSLKIPVTSNTPTK